MTAEIRVPTLGESITEATVAKWFKQPGDAVALDEILCELETDKVAVEVPAPVAGVLTDIAVGEGEDVEVGALLGTLEENAKGAAKPTAKTTPKPAPDVKHEATAKQAPAAKPVYDNMAPAAERLLQEHKVDPAQISGTGKDGRITKADVMAFLDKGAATEPVQEKAAAAPAAKPAAPRSLADREERVPMSRLRRTIASRLKEAQNTAAILTTFNEVDMSALKDLRSKYKDLFADKHGVRLGFMSLFAKACVVALKDIPSVNAEIDGNDIIYKNHYDIGIAVSSPQGLVVPVVRDVDQLSLAGIEKRIAELADAARDGKLAIADLQGATFSISNGGVFGSMLSTPILNPPQSGILGMHAIQDRPVARDGQVVIRPMMYVALSYDHRLVDGREAVTFLVRVKECLEDPERLLLDL